MDRHQKIAAWLLGGLIVLTLALTGHGIGALVVAAVLITILSLRDRQKKKKSTSSSSLSEADKPNRTTPEMILKNVTPHTLAVGMLQLMRESGDMWRTPEIKIPQEAKEAVELACQFYELRIYIDMLKQRFGSGISKLVEASFTSILDEIKGLALFSKVSSAIVCARSLGPVTHEKTRELESPANAETRLDLQVADQILSLFGESDEQRESVRFPLAQSLSRARISAQRIFPEFVAKIDFAPLSVAMVTRETGHN